jgi:o-succinylbenzoate---CoA ligase
VEPWLVRAARLNPDRPALIAPGAQLSYAQLLDRALGAGGALIERGVKPGDRVGLALSGAELVIAVHACLAIGAVALPLDLRLRESERAQRAETAVLVLEQLERAGRATPRPLTLDATATLMFTSGTTAGPKPVELSYDNWLWNAIGSALALGLDPDERWLCPMPLAHVGGLSIQLRSAIYGTAVVLHDRFETEAVLRALVDPQLRVTLVSLVPTMLARLLDAGLERPPSLRRVLLGGGPIAPALLRRAAAAGVAVSPSYGMTETCSQVVTDGAPLLGVELRLADDREILVRGPAVAAGSVAADGWLHTGDLGRFDAGGRLALTGRKADTIVSGGENVAPAEVEAVLIEHPAVADAAVLGRADPEWGEAVIAQVVLRDGLDSERAARELREHCAARLAAFKVPKRVEIVASLPRNQTGKLLRRELR